MILTHPQPNHISKMYASLLFVPVFLFVQLKFLPSLELAAWLPFAIMIDWVTGIINARINDRARTSKRYRAGLKKITQYAGLILLSVLISNVSDRLPHSEILAPLFGNGLLAYILYIEIVSIMENLFGIDKKSKLATYVIKPVLNVLTFQLKNNPATRLTNDTITPSPSVPPIAELNTDVQLQDHAQDHPDYAGYTGNDAAGGH